MEKITIAPLYSYKIRSEQPNKKVNNYRKFKKMTCCDCEQSERHTKWKELINKKVLYLILYTVYLYKLEIQYKSTSRIMNEYMDSKCRTVHVLVKYQ